MLYNALWLTEAIGDVSLSAEDKPPDVSVTRISYPSSGDHQTSDSDLVDDGYLDDDEEDEHHSWLEGHTALRFLFAGGVAGAGY